MGNLTISLYQIPKRRIAGFCRNRKVRELSLFGSVTRQDFGPESDIDVLISFSKDAAWDLFDLIDMADELKEIFGRDVDLVEKEALRNPYRRDTILSTRKVVYAT
ncbi:MAG: Nucleotidyltransferase domain protein [Syntrophorhabdaceae bacterium PtaU1.Bin034]|nr:MAG: Nucleotidyltransferase domain protein [Syntrophorhabdaceae bacterium PtaU1.Bin034]